MKHYKCEGCGQSLQTKEISGPGFTPRKESLFCKKCFRMLHYGERENNLTIFQIQAYLEKLKKEDNEVIMIVDILNPYQTFISNINQYVSSDKITVIVNKVDVLPKAISSDAIIRYISKIAENRKISFKNISLVSSIKLNNIDALYDYIQTLNNKVSIIGYSNVGKTSFIKALFKSKSLKINSLVSHTIGTTLEPIKLNIGEKKIIDYPGFYLEGNIQNFLTGNQLKLIIPRKEIKVKTLQLHNNQLVRIGEYAHFVIVESKQKCGYQFSFSNDIEITRHKFSNFYESSKEMIEYKVKPLGKVYRQDIIISGLGVITFSNIDQELMVRVPKGIKIDIVESLYSKE